jgi:PhzF family phenazine biosynthesis protein
MKLRPFKQVDVFTATPYFGNPLAVVLDGHGLTDDTMQRFAQWTNLSETTFLLPPTDPSADYRVRIFTPGGELPFAGHPTLGSCHAWLQAGGQPHSKDVIVQECKQGLVKIRREPPYIDGQRLAFAAPPLKRSAPSPVLLAQVAAALGLKAQQIIAAQLLDNGPVWFTLLLDSPETVLQLTPDHLQLKKLDVKVGVAAAYPREAAPPLIGRANREARAFDMRSPEAADGPTPDFEVRAFAASVGINEDPVTGSLNASLAQWLMAEGHAPERYLASQGVCLGRAGQVHLERDAAGQVWVGGESVTCINGQLAL